MADTTTTHFDYLADHDIELELSLGLSDLSKDVNHWRTTGMNRPDEALIFCRKVMETSLKTLLDPLPEERMSLVEVIDYAKDKKTIDRSMAAKCHEIRIKGNQGVHEYKSVKAIDAQMTLDLLDDFLRWNAEELGFLPSGSYKKANPKDPIFIVKPAEEMATVSRKARLAAALSDDKTIDKKAQKVKAQAAKYDEQREAGLSQIEDLIKQADAIGASSDGRRRLLEHCDASLEKLEAEERSLEADIEDVSTEIQEILSEHDFIKRLLKGDNAATEKQLDVMAFPRGANTVTNILQIAGGAGTGKTLCLLAKLIAEVDDGGQASMFDNQRKTALFICFNKGLKKYVEGILDGYADVAPSIEVASYDEYVNQLVRNKPKRGFEHLARYASHARYERASITYGFKNGYVDSLKEAQRIVAARHPDRTNAYYLDSSEKEDFDWLKAELNWIEARFEDDADAAAKYPTADRIGRGTTRRPNETIRRVILEIRQELNRILDYKGLYTIEQATKRLLGVDDLPAYDAIAIDEVQDFSLISIKLITRFRRGEDSKVFLSGDENQKIYQRDFTWKELDEGLRGFTITLRENKRNTDAIRRFSDRLLGKPCKHELASHYVHVESADDNRTIELLRKLMNAESNRTTVLITSNADWYGKLRDAGIPAKDAKTGEIHDPGLYIMGNMVGKGLEFDNVVVDYARNASDDEAEEKRLRYVHFTRARRRLYIRYEGTPPSLLQKFYGDFLPNWDDPEIPF